MVVLTPFCPIGSLFTMLSHYFRTFWGSFSFKNGLKTCEPARGRLFTCPSHSGNEGTLHIQALLGANVFHAVAVFVPKVVIADTIFFQIDNL